MVFRLTIASGMSPIVRNVDRYEECILRTRVPRWRRAYSSDVGPNMHTMTSAMSDSAAVLVAWMRLSAASDDGRSDDRCDPTITIGTGESCSMKFNADAV